MARPLTASSGAGGTLACVACGAPVVPGGRFCFACGVPLQAQAATAPASDAAAERRVVTVLFGDLSDFTAWAEDRDPERVGVVTDRLLAALADAVAAVGGHVDKLTGDGIMAVFGAPVAHEDDPQRAVHAAVQMQTAVRRLVADEAGGGRRLGLRVGINTGEVLAGVQAALAYTVVGDTVNTAARLSDAAGVGGVYAGRETALATASIASWRALPPLRLKGKREPVAAYELVRLRSAGTDRIGVGEEAPFVGRDAELGLLVGRLVDVGDRGEPASVLVAGEAGVGKSRLATELARFAGELPDARVLWGRCTRYGEGRDLAPLVDMIRTACGLDGGEEGEQPPLPASAAAARVRRAVVRLQQPASGASPAGVADRLLELLGLGPSVAAPPRDAATPGTPPVGADPALEAVAALFTALAVEGPLVLVVDDVHAASRPLLDALLAVARRLAGPVLLLCLGRPELFDLRPGWWRELPAPELLPLAPLEGPATERLLRAYLRGAELDPSVRELLLERAQGNPFFLAELLHLLVDRGLLRLDGGVWVLAGTLPHDMLPAGVQAVLAARIDGLDPTAKAVLRDAAVVGGRFSPEVLVALGQPLGAADEAGVRRALAVLAERQLIRPVGDGKYVFGHTLARDVAYAGISKAERARRHAAVAGWAARAAHDRLEGADAFLAAQAERAVELAREMALPAEDPAWKARRLGFGALARLGRAALARDDRAAAEFLLAAALWLGADPALGPPEPAEAVLPVRVAHAAALAALHRLAEAEAELPDALQSPDVGVLAEALVVLGEVHRRRGEDEAAVAAFVRALTAAAEAGLDRVSGEALRQLGLLDYFNGRLRAAEERFRQAHQLAERVGDQRGAGWALQHLAWSATTRGDYATADEALERAADVFAALDDTGGLSWCAGTEAYVRLLQGRLGEARELSGSLLSVGEALGERFGVAACLTIDAIAAAELGDVETAAVEADRARGLFEELGDLWGQALALVAAGIAARGVGAPERAVLLLRRSVELSADGRHPLTGSLALVMLGYNHLDRGQLGPAGEAARAAIRLLSELDLEPRAVVGAKVLLAQVRRARGDLDGALALLTEVTAAAGEPSLLFPRRQALAHHAGALLAAGRPAEALAVARRAVTEPAEDVRSRTVALRALGVALAATGDRAGAQAALRDALAVACSTGHRSEVAATERALAALPR